jgi:hypothetical protein
MASLILHGDRNANGVPMQRLLYVRPVLITDENGYEHTDKERLVIDTVNRAIVRIKGSEGQEAAAPYSISRQPFTWEMSAVHLRE